MMTVHGPAHLHAKVRSSRPVSETRIKVREPCADLPLHPSVCGDHAETLGPGSPLSPPSAAHCGHRSGKRGTGFFCGKFRMQAGEFLVSALRLARVEVGIASQHRKITP